MSTSRDRSGESVPSLSDLRRRSFSVAYRMLGSVAEAEDVVQEAFLRWQRAKGAGVSVDSPGAYLTTITTRLAIDYFRSARRRRESYVGVWLPEPLVEEREPEIIHRAETKDTVSMAFLLLLETLSPVERAVFVLREAFDLDFGEIAGIVEKSEQNCRQLYHRSKHHVESRRPRFEASSAKRDELAGKFLAACQDGDLDGLLKMLASDVSFQGDGGGKATAVVRTIEGRERVARLLRGLFEKGGRLGIHLRPTHVNGQPGGVFLDAQDRLINVISIDIAHGRVQCLRSVVNPDKLRHLGPTSPLTGLPPSAHRPEG